MQSCEKWAVRIILLLAANFFLPVGAHASPTGASIAVNFGADQGGIVNGSAGVLNTTNWNNEANVGYRLFPRKRNHTWAFV
jgi:hypothetical protein